MKALNRFFRVLATLGVQLLYTITLYLTAVAFGGVLTTILLTVSELNQFYIPYPIWLIWLVVSVPIWIGFEIYVMVKTIKYFKQIKKKKDLQNQVLQNEIKK